MTDAEQEKSRQQSFKWNRSYHSQYNSLLGYYQVQAVLENAKSGSILDLACGDGTLTALLAPHFNKVVGVDASGTHLAKAREKCPEVEFIESLIETLEIGERFDVITMLDILEHVIDPVLTLQRAASFLREDGVLIAHVPNALAVNRVIARIMGTLLSEYELSPFDINIAGHRRSYDINLLLKDFEAANLEVVATGGVFYKMLSTPQIDWLLEKGDWEVGHGWGRTGVTNKDWRWEFCRACYEYGKQHPEECNIIYACGKKET